MDTHDATLRLHTNLVTGTVGSWVFPYCTDYVVMADAGGSGTTLKRGGRLCNTMVVYPSVLVRRDFWTLH
uniref:FAD_binding_3 domain-containing protein n=1 Tax=Echinococcus granulosus TaxID=6210 RepID=A0A068X4C8_ECHGR|nr:hypothetical protein EgrG_000094500 [Echinococcus granulosus]